MSCSYISTKYFLLHVCIPCSSGRGSFPALSAAGQAGDPGVHHGASVGPGRAPWRTLWAIKKSRDWAGIHGIALRLDKPRRTMENPKYNTFAVLSAAASVSCITPSLKLSSSLLGGSQGTSSYSFDHGHGRCICVCVFVPCFRSTYCSQYQIETNASSQESAIN